MFVLELGTDDEVNGCAREELSSAIRTRPPKGMDDRLVRGDNRPDQDCSDL